MGESLSHRRLAENEVFFRQPNQQVVEGLQEYEKLAKAQNQTALLPDTDRPIQFYCECSDEKCRQRILLKPSKYAELHQNSSQFVILPGHNIPEIERIVQSEPDYVVIEKYQAPPREADVTHPTDLDHH